MARSALQLLPYPNAAPINRSVRTQQRFTVLYRLNRILITLFFIICTEKYCTYMAVLFYLDLSILSRSELKSFSKKKNSMLSHLKFYSNTRFNKYISFLQNINIIHFKTLYKSKLVKIS